jgi:hypothetical protein
MSRGLAFVVLTLPVLMWGCGGSEATPTPPTPAQVFDSKQGGKTVTPHGTIVAGSAQDGEGGSVIYKTDDGKSWKVQPRKDGTYDTPEPAK